jgi:hypothetical protein
MAHATDVRTTDPLGLGGLLSDACRVAQLMACGAFESGNLLESLLTAAQEGLAWYARREDWRQPASRRLAFRELGLAIGISGIELVRKHARQPHFTGRPALQAVLDDLARYRDLGPSIVADWLDDEHRRSGTWLGHCDINEVMLATSLVPEGLLVLLPRG